jgi:hypothetical protein
MTLTFDTNELNYVFNLLMQRPLGEVEPLVVKLRQQIAAQQAQTPVDLGEVGKSE